MDNAFIVEMVKRVSASPDALTACQKIANETLSKGFGVTAHTIERLARYVSNGSDYSGTTPDAANAFCLLAMTIAALWDDPANPALKREIMRQSLEAVDDLPTEDERSAVACYRLCASNGIETPALTGAYRAAMKSLRERRSSILNLAYRTGIDSPYDDAMRLVHRDSCLDRKKLPLFIRVSWLRSTIAGWSHYNGHNGTAHYAHHQIALWALNGGASWAQAARDGADAADISQAKKMLNWYGLTLKNGSIVDAG